MLFEPYFLDFCELHSRTKAPCEAGEYPQLTWQRSSFWGLGFLLVKWSPTLVLMGLNGPTGSRRLMVV